MVFARELVTVAIMTSRLRT